MENQPNPRNCENCAFAIEGPVDPTSLRRLFRCAWGPPQMIVIPTPQGASMTVAHPPVDSTMLCHQHKLKTEISNAKNPDEKGPVN